MNPIDLFLLKIPDAKPSGNGWSALCPGHDDRTPSLSISEAADGRVLLCCHKGCKIETICAALGLRTADLMPTISYFTGPREKRQSPPRKQVTKRPGKSFTLAEEAVEACNKQVRCSQNGKRVAEYRYCTLSGEHVASVIRYDLPTPPGERQMKTFRPISKQTDGWRLCDPKGKWPLYGLQMLGSGKRVYIVEGEKTADTARSLGLVAVTSAHGASAADKTDWSPLAGRECVVLPDFDDAGAKYANQVAEQLGKLENPPVVKIVTLPGLTDHGDLCDWVDHHGDAAEPDGMRREIERLVDAVDSVAEFGTKAVVVSLADVTPQRVRWLWENRIALGKLTLISGDPGLGKSFLTIDLAARVSTGKPWPDDPRKFAPLGSVAILSAEDDIADTIRPRMDAAGADCRKIVIIEAIRDAGTNGATERSFDLSRDLSCLEKEITKLSDCRLVIIDPISCYLGKTKSHDNAEVRSVLAPLVTLASKMGFAVVAVSHLRKSEGAAIHRTMGSLAFVAAARAAFIVVRDKKDADDKRRLFLPIKNNIGNDRTGLAYRLIPHDLEGGVPALEWDSDPVTITADEAMAPLIPSKVRKSERQNAAASFLSSTLANGPVLSTEVYELAKHAHEIPKRTLDRAKQDLGVVAFRLEPTGPWFMRLPSVQHANNEDVPKTSDVWHCGNLGQNSTISPSLDPSCDQAATISEFGNLGQTLTG